MKQGRTDEFAYFVVVRTAPEVSRLVAVTDRGAHVELVLGDVDGHPDSPVPMRQPQSGGAGP